MTLNNRYPLKSLYIYQYLSYCCPDRYHSLQHRRISARNRSYNIVHAFYPFFRSDQAPSHPLPDKYEQSGTYELRVGNLNTRRAIMDQRDLIQALLLLSEKGHAGDVYNISSEYIYRMDDIVRMIEREIGHKLERCVDQQLLRPTDERVIVGDITKIKRDTGWMQEIPMQQTVHDMLEYWRKK